MALGKINIKKACDFADNLNINEVKSALTEKSWDHLFCFVKINRCSVYAG
jgi:hypothetical protein